MPAQVASSAGDIARLARYATALRRINALSIHTSAMAVGYAGVFARKMPFDWNAGSGIFVGNEGMPSLEGSASKWMAARTPLIAAPVSKPALRKCL
jgi:hypothetical protein